MSQVLKQPVLLAFIIDYDRLIWLYIYIYKKKKKSAKTNEIFMMFCFLLLFFLGDDAQLVFTSSKGMQWISINGTGHRKLAPHLPGPGPVTALASNRNLYWARQGRGSIYR